MADYRDLRRFLHVKYAQASSDEERQALLNVYGAATARRESKQKNIKNVLAQTVLGGSISGAVAAAKGAEEQALLTQAYRDAVGAAQDAAVQQGLQADIEGAEEQATEQEKQQLQARRGRSSTILTRQRGMLGTGSVRRAQLLGG